MVLTAKELAKTSPVLTARPDDSLSSALYKMHSSHDAVFVKDGTKLLGVISPYHVLYRTDHPGSTKVKNCLFAPPKLKPDTPVDKIARLMLESKIYFLPLINGGGKWLGVVSYRRLLRRHPNLDLKAKPKPVITAVDNLTVGQARSLMKARGISRLVVVNRSGRLTGILTRYDLNGALGRPSGEKNELLTWPVKQFIKKNVVTANPRTPANQLVQVMLDKRIGSVVLIDNQYRPTGLVSVRDCLETIARPAQQETQVSFQFPKNFRFAQAVIGLVNRWRSRLKRWPLLRFNLRLNAHRNAANLDSGYKVLVQAKPAHDKEVFAKASGRNWKLALRKSLGRLTKQLARR